MFKRCKKCGAKVAKDATQCQSCNWSDFTSIETAYNMPDKKGPQYNPMQAPQQLQPGAYIGASSNDSIKTAQAPPPPPPGGGMDMGGLGGDPAGGAGLPKKKPKSVKYTSDEVKMMSDPYHEDEENTDINDIATSADDLAIDG